VERLASKLPVKIIACSQATADRLRSELRVRGPIAVVPNGIDAQSMFALTPAKRQSSLVFVGRLMTYKNVDLLVKAVAHLKKKGEIVDCTIIGNGPEKEHLEALAAKLGVAGQVTFTGFIEASEEVYALVKAAKVFVLPSEREGFGIVALEANACGIPVLTLDHPGNAARHLVATGQNGGTFAPTPAALATAISRTLAAPRQTTAQACRAFAERFDWHTLSTQVAQAYLRGDQSSHTGQTDSAEPEATA
jgi:L-malate glycosyltransferase